MIRTLLFSFWLVSWLTPIPFRAMTAPDAGQIKNAGVYLNPDTGRFWTMDNFDGINEDPLSIHKYLYGTDNPVNRIDPSGYEGEAISFGAVMTGSLVIDAFEFGAINWARINMMAKIGVIAGTVAIATSGGDRANNRNNPYLMRLQFQESPKGADYHYWSAPISGTQVPGISPPRYNPVTKRQVQEQLGFMFAALKSQDYVQQKGWSSYNLGSDEPKLWSAIIRMSLFVQTHGPTPPGPDPTWHQEYLDPNDTTSPRIDLENIIGTNLGL